MPGGAQSAWQKRMRSAGFRSQLAAALRSDVEDLAGSRVEEVVDAAALRRAVAAAGPELFDPKSFAEIFVHAANRAEGRAAKQSRSLQDLLDPGMVSAVGDLLDQDLDRPGVYDDLVASVIRQEFFAKLFAEIIHSAIVSFNKRVNPLFGGIATSVLEDQIKGFIALGMPMLQEQAVAFALSPANRRFATDLSRSVMRGLSQEPLKTLVPRTSTRHHRQAERLIADLLRSPQFQGATTRALLTGWDDVYPKLRRRKLGELVDMEAFAGVIAEPAAVAIADALARPAVASLFQGLGARG